MNSIQWKIAGVLPASPGQATSLGFAGPVAGFHNEKFIIAGGANFPEGMPWLGGKKKYYKDVFVFSKKGDKLALCKNKYQLPANIAYSATCSTPEGVFAGGGENENGISNKSFLLQWDKLSASVVIKDLPDLPLALTNAASTVHEQIIYVAGGESAGRVSDKFFGLDLREKKTGWKELPPLPKPLSHTLLITQMNKDRVCVYAIGGREKKPDGISELFNSVYEFDIPENRWRERKPLPYALSAGTGIARSTDAILVFGGDKGETFHETEKLIAAINSEKDETRKQELTNQKNKLQQSHPGFSNEVLQYNTAKDEWTPAGKIPFDTPVTTIAVKSRNDFFIPSGEIKAGIRTPQILRGRYNLNRR